MGQTDEVDERLEELEKELDREAAAAQRAVDSPADDRTDGAPDAETSSQALTTTEDPEAGGGSDLAIQGLAFLGGGVALFVTGTIVLPVLLAPLFGAFWLALVAFKLTLLGALAYGLYALWGKLAGPEKD